MVQRAELMGLGLSHNLANQLGIDPQVCTAVGATQGSAYQINRQQKLVSVISTNSGNYVNAPSVTAGAHLCDLFVVNNQTAGSIVVTASSGVNFSFGGSSIAGTTGFSVASQNTVLLMAVSASSWVALKGA